MVMQISGHLAISSCSVAITSVKPVPGTGRHRWNEEVQQGNPLDLAAPAHGEAVKFTNLEQRASRSSLV